MKIFGSIQELVELVYRKGSNTVTLKPNTSQATNVTVSLPLLTGNDTIVTDTSTSTLSNKSVSGDTNTLSNIAITSLKTVLADANKVVLRDASGAVISASIANVNVDATAAIALTKLASVADINRALQSDGSGKIVSSSVTSTELGHLSGVTSAIQTQLDAKVDENPAIVGATATKITFDSKGLVTAGTALAAGDLPSGIDATKIGAGSVDNTEFGYLNGVTSDIQTQINAKADSSALTAHTGASSGVHGVTGSVVGTSDTQILTNKDIAGGTASNTSRITLPSAAKSTLDGLTRKQATLVYGTDTNKVYADDGSTLKEIGSGSSGINYLASQFAADSLGTVQTSVGDVLASSTRSNPTQWGNSAASALITQSTDGTLRGTTNYLVQYSANAQFVESPLFTIDGEDLGKPLLVQFDVSGVSTDDDVQVYIARYDSSNVLQERILVAGTASATTPNSAQVPTNVTTFKGFFITSSTATDKYAVRWLRNANNTSMRLDTFFVGPQSLAQGAVVTGWQSYTPTFEGFGTVASVTSSYRRIGDTIEISGAFTSGTPTAVAATISLPSGLNIDTSKTGSSAGQTIIYGFIARGNSTATALPATTRGPFPITDSRSTSTSKLYIAIQSDSGAGGVFQANLGSSVAASGDKFTFTFRVPISQWSSGTTTLADRAVEEYASNNSATTANDTSSFINGPDGFAIQAFAPAGQANIAKRVRFQTPILPTDIIQVEFYDGTLWRPIGNTIFGFNINDAGTTYYGVQIVGVNSTDVDVRFYSAVGPGLAWSTVTSSKWRVRKVSGGAAVGFPIEYSNITMQGEGNGLFYQSEAATLTFTGFSTATTLSVTITRVGNVVTMLIPAIGAKTKDGTVNLTATGIPTWARPAAALHGLAFYEATNTLSGVIIGTTGGLQVYRTSNWNNWVASTAYNFTAATSLTWIV